MATSNGGDLSFLNGAVRVAPMAAEVAADPPTRVGIGIEAEADQTHTEVAKSFLRPAHGTRTACRR